MLYHMANQCRMKENLSWEKKGFDTKKDQHQNT